MGTQTAPVAMTPQSSAPSHEPSWAELAVTDSLTGLSNRRSFEQNLLNALAAEEQPSVLLLDLDRFKAVNDTLGHPIGDQLLTRVADRIRTVVPSTSLLARLGGDEFAILCSPSCSQQEVERLAAQVIELIERPFLIDAHPINIGVSIGIAMGTEAGVTYEVLMKHADLALYAAKEGGRGNYRAFHQSLADTAQERRKLELDLRRALPLRQLEVQYRPRLDIDTGQLIGLQAVLFWRHPQRGLLESSAFLPLATQIGLAPRLGSWLLEAACREGATLPNAPQVAVAVPPAQFAATAIGEGSFVEIVEKALAHSSLVAHRLEIQITEGILLAEDEAILKALHRLRGLGVRIVMNDFGMGYASLTRLTSFPFDGIKLAPHFAVQAQSSANRAIVHAVASLGASLGLTTHIDGVVSRDQIEQLRLAGAQSVCGCKLGPALPTSELRELLPQLQSASQEIV